VQEVSQIIDDLIKAFRLLLNPADGVRALLFNATQILSVNYPQPYLILYDKLVKVHHSFDTKNFISCPLINYHHCIGCKGRKVGDSYIDNV